MTEPAKEFEQITDPDLRKALESLSRAMNTNPRQAEPERFSAKVIQFPSWQEPVRGTPNSFLRSALFAAIQGKERKALRREPIACPNGLKIIYTGWQLDQSDLDVWEQAAHLARQHPLGNVCRFHIHAFLKELGRSTGKSDHEWLKDVFARLTASGVEITDGRYSYGGSLLEFLRDDVEGIYILRLNPTIMNMYHAGWTAVDWEIRGKLRRKPLALWLHGFYSTHAGPHPIKVETLHKLSGSRQKDLRNFKIRLKQALADLETAARSNP